MKDIQWELSCFLKNNPISNHTDSRVRLWNCSIPAGSRSVEVLSVWSRMGQSQCLFTLGPLGELWWGFVRCQSHHHISHQPLTAAKRCLGLSMQASAQLGSIPYIFLKKIWSILGEESACYAGGETGVCPACPQGSHLPHAANLSQQGWVGRGLSAPAKMWSSLCLEKASGWLISANCLVTSLFLKAQFSRCDK